MAATVRLFVAVPVPSAVRQRVDTAIGGLRDRYRDLRWARPEGWHVTLAFLGQVDERRVGDVEAAVEEAVTAVGVGPVELSVDDAGHFKRRVLWLGLEARPRGGLRDVGSTIQRTLIAAGLPCDEKPVHPHITLARSRGRSRLPRGVVEEVPAVEVSWTADSVHVLRSHLGKGGSRYETLVTVSL